MDDLYGLAEHDDFEMGAEDMERLALRVMAEADADMEALADFEMYEADTLEEKSGDR